MLLLLLLLLLLLPIPGSDDPFCAVAVESHFFYGWMGGCPDAVSISFERELHLTSTCAPVI